MLIDWFTVAAQIVNFLALVWLLKRFLYGRVLRAIESRESRIVASMTEAEAKEKEAGRQQALYESKVRDIEEQRESALAEAKLDAEKQRAAMLEKAHEKIRLLEAAWREELERGRNAFLADLRRRAATEVLAIARRTVADLACVDVQQSAVKVFLDKLRAMDREAWKGLAGGEMLVRTAFELPADMQAEIRRTIEDQLKEPVRLQFENAPGIGLGLELRGNGRRIGWNSESYLEALEEDLRRALEENPDHCVPAGLT
jgi:F-type H+-transporting ATPase subunit b